MFRDNLKEQIEYKGLIIKELAAKSGISKRTIDTYVDSRAVVPNAEVAVKLAEALDTTVEYLVNGVEKKRTLDIPKKEHNTFDKYKKILDDLNMIPQEELPIIEAIVHTVAKEFSKRTKSKNKS